MERMNKLSKAVSKADRIYYIVIDTFLILMLLAILYPLYFIVIASISDTDAIFNGEVFLYPIVYPSTPRSGWPAFPMILPWVPAFRCGIP